MKIKILSVLCICFLFVSLAICEQSPTISNAASPAPTPETPGGPTSFDICRLLRPNEIEARIGSPIKESKSSESRTGGLHISQCIYVAEQLNKSVSLVVTQTDARQGGKQNARDFWRERFGRYREQSEEEKDEARHQSNEGEEREGRPPLRIKGLGDEAYWTAGSLYVLHGEVFFRLSIGGPEPEEAKLERSKALATIALKRL